MKLRTLTASIEVPVPLGEVFSFFANAQNLQLITPPDLGFEIMTPTPIEMRPGLQLDYRVRIRRFPARWTSLISVWDPPYRFVDEQVRGPYLRWHHLHEFQATAQGTRILDSVEYAVPGWVLEGLAHRFLVQPDLVRIFSYRTERIAERFGLVGEAPPPRFRQGPREVASAGPGAAADRPA